MAGNNDKTIGDVIDLMDKAIAKVDGMRAGLVLCKIVLRALSATSLMLLLMRLMLAHVFVMLTLLKSLANLSQQSIIQQAAASMLMQANTRPQLGLSLLG